MGIHLFILQLMTIFVFIGGSVSVSDHLRDVLSEDIFKLSASFAGTEFCQ